MIIVCESCKTRFKLADEHIPAERAKVRCSRCQHSFHIEPPHREPEKPPPATFEHTVGHEPEEPLGPVEDSDLENPEFIYEAEPGESEEPVFGGGDAQDFDLESSQDSDPEPVSDAEELSFHPTSEPDFTPDAEPELQEDSTPVARWDDLDESAEEAVDEWDSFEERVDPDPAPEVRKPIPILSTKEPPALDTDSAPASLADAPAVAAGVDRDVISRRWFASVLAALVGAVLIAGGLRALRLHAIEPIPGPPTVRASGWVATDIQAVHVRDAEARPVLVVRGSLSSDPSAPPASVQATLLDAAGGALGPAVSGIMLRLEGGALAPEAVTRRLAETTAARPARQARGFTVLIPDPPERARRYRLEIVPAAKG